MSNDTSDRNAGNSKADGEYTDADPIDEKAPKPEDEGTYTDSELPPDAV
ncbi:MAG: hypothetical protein RI885_2794 [Actinomycetota bacterium]